jgi:nicotinamide-nucleotide amidase
VAESCTGGFISQQITLVPGSSDYYRGSVTAYSNDIKKNILGVSLKSITQYGAVSSEVAKEMANGALKALNADIALATTGIAGPGGGTPQKPVGTVWIAIANTEKVVATKYVFGNNRERNIIRSGQTALQLLRRFILEEM